MSAAMAAASVPARSAGMAAPASPSGQRRSNPLAQRYTSRGGILGQLTGFGIAAGVYAALGYVTFFFARRALVELWHHGYLAVSTTTAKPELNLILRFFLDASGPSVPIDAARVDFNLFLRYATGAILFMIALICSSTAAQVLATERAKDTWNSLIATPLSGRDILLGKLRAALWRLRGIGITILTLWTLGLVTGAIHPLGYLAAILTLATSTGFYLVAGLLAALKASDQHATAGGRALGLVILPISSAFLPFCLPAAVGSIAWGVASTPLIAWLSLVSYREASIAWHSPVYPLLHWIGVDWGDGTLMVVLTCTIAIIAPSSSPAGSGVTASPTSTAWSAVRAETCRSKPSPECGSSPLRQLDAAGRSTAFTACAYENQPSDRPLGVYVTRIPECR